MLRFSQCASIAFLLVVCCLPRVVPAGSDADSTPDPVLVQVVAGDWRTPANRARDAARHPIGSLTFWGLAPGMSILEVQPGGASWWTEILAPYARLTGGRYVATGADLDDPNLSEGARRSRQEFEKRYGTQAEIYGRVEVVNWGRHSKPLPSETFDFILTARSVHGWMGAGMTEKAFGEFYRALKPGGILALEQHRANPGPQDPQARSGYVTEAFVIEQAEKAGFELAGRSEINANPRDTKDHPFGVWTLPPARRTTPYGSEQASDPSFDRSRYDAIGESDRMTLRFVKPDQLLRNRS